MCMIAGHSFRKIVYSLLNDAVVKSPKKAYQEALLLDKPGNYYVIVEAEDNLGKISNKKMSFIVKAG